ncbi:signal transduction histidine kinase/CheY-like chemotaxis protein/CHASE3 domain sensor protein [Rhodopirellula rubra]|uniref:histidine kinase n=1 Tax=Aporhodopirellula rubra TaxID=980271 RepID=A0A7W5E344_9BACT|nr:response regulator [Aporhodopirellula rubra]MBB3209238.1 signal transduction histidine kinase/CheY-like chemotaxis protein/CHASE3 domain sensor protein [Aporhodopirellula rubra]
MPANTTPLEKLGRDWTRWLAPTGLMIALAMLLLTGLATYRNVREFADSAEWVVHTREVLASLEALSSDLSEAESTARAFYLTNEDRYRDEYQTSIVDAREHEAALLEQTKDNAVQHARMRELSALIEPKILSMSTYASADSISAEDDLWRSQTLRNDSSLMREIRDRVAELNEAERKLLVERTENYRSMMWQTRWAVIASTLLATALVVGTYLLLRRHWRLSDLSTTSERRHHREKDELARYNQRLLESTGEGIYGIDANGRCTFINRAGALLLGGKPADFQDKDMHAVVHYAKPDGTVYELQECPIYRSMRTGDGCRVDDEVFWRLDGKSVPVEYSSFPLRGTGVDSELIEGAVVTFAGISARLRSQNELREAKELAEAANESKSQFLANMSHELRTPLNAVIMYSELLAEEAEDHNVPSFIPDLKRIRFAGKHLLELVNGVLDLSKVEAGKMEVFAEQFSVPKMIEEVIATVEPLVEKNRNVIHFEIFDGVDEIQGDVTKLRQVLYNLLANASKFTEDGKITVRVGQNVEQNKLIIDVEDTGIGMTEEQVDRLFQPFMQADASTTRKYGGTGLGLAIIKRFTDLMLGNVSVASVKGEGTTFTVTVPTKLNSTPQAVSPMENAAPTAEMSMVGNEGASVVLVIDDDPAVRDILTRVLINEGIRPITAMDGEDGLLKAREHRPDLIILDVNMPKVDGWSVLSTLKADDELADIPVVMQSVQDDRDLGFMLGASEYLVKPVNRDRLLSMLQKYLRDGEGTVLIVDDDEPTRRAIQRTLSTQSWDIVQAIHGADAVDRMHEKIPSVILLDLMMPTMDGFEFLDILKSNPLWQNVPVVVMTAKELTNDDRERLAGGVERVLAKSGLDRHRFLDEVRRIVQSVAKPTPTV